MTVAAEPATITLRQGQDGDYDGICRVIRAFFDESVGAYHFSIDLASIQKSMAVVLKEHIAIVALLDDEIIGCIGGTLAPLDFNHNLKMATELVWYVKAEHRDGTVGARLIQAFEATATAKGATHIAMSYMENLQPERLRLFYEKRGYKPMQTQYIRSAT